MEADRRRWADGERAEEVEASGLVVGRLEQQAAGDGGEEAVGDDGSAAAAAGAAAASVGAADDLGRVGVEGTLARAGRWRRRRNPPGMFTVRLSFKRVSWPG